MLHLHYDELPDAIGTRFGPSEAVPITQSRIDLFAEATEDRQWIHTDAARAADGPFGLTIAHGYLTLSLVSAFLEQMLVVSGSQSVINYGSDRVRFPSPLPVGSSVRASGEITEVQPGGGWTQAAVRVTIECDGGSRPVCVAEVLLRYYAHVEG